MCHVFKNLTPPPSKDLGKALEGTPQLLCMFTGRHVKLIYYATQLNCSCGSGTFNPQRNNFIQEQAKILLSKKLDSHFQ